MWLLHSFCCDPHSNLPYQDLWPSNQKMQFHAAFLLSLGVVESKTLLTVSLGWGKFSPLRSPQDCQLSLRKHAVFLHPPTLLPVYHSWNGFLFSRERRCWNCIDFSVDSYLPKKNHQESKEGAKSQFISSPSVSQILSQDLFCLVSLINSPPLSLFCHWRSYEPDPVWSNAD